MIEPSLAHDTLIDRYLPEPNSDYNEVISAPLVTNHPSGTAEFKGIQCHK